MRLNLSENAAKQMAEQSAKKETDVSISKAEVEAARNAKREAKLVAKQAKVDARNRAKRADVDLQTQLDAYRSAEGDIAAATKQMQKDQDEYNARCAKKLAALKLLQRELERVHEEAKSAEAALAATRADVPKSVSGAQERTQKLNTRREALAECFAGNEAAWNGENLTKSYKGKRNTGLRRTVKGIING